MYSTPSTLYVATTEFQHDFPNDSARFGRGFKTSMHEFSLSLSNVNYVGSGDVSGSVLNQFSMHEYMGTFFVATTDGA